VTHAGHPWTLEQREITPATAARWVRTSRGKRLHCTKRTKLEAYVLLMQSGRWKPNGRIVIQDNFVVDGRYALAAIARSGIPQTMYVLRVTTQPSSHPELR
jgi:hypothetical protein